MTIPHKHWYEGHYMLQAQATRAPDSSDGGLTGFLRGSMGSQPASPVHINPASHATIMDETIHLGFSPGQWIGPSMCTFGA